MVSRRILLWQAAWTAALLMLGRVYAATNAQDAPQGSDLVWQSAGPGGGGWIQSIAWDPHAADTLYVGCDVGGLYFSTDAGRHYERRNQGLCDYFVEAIAVHPRDRRILLLGTESGIHRSTDQGKTWQWIRAGFPALQQYAFSAPIGAVAFDGRRPNVVYAGVGRPRWNKDGAGAIYRSDDAGLTWRLVSAGQLPADAIVRDLELRPDSSQSILAATQHGVYRSDDEGKNWAASSEGLPHRDVAELALALSAPQVVYASLRTTARDGQPFNGGVCRSDDAGKTWKTVNGLGMPNRVGRSGQSSYMSSQIKELAVDPRNPDVVYAGAQSWVTSGVYKTEDGGRHWTRATRHGRGSDRNMDLGWIDFWGPAVECLAIATLRPGRLAFGTSGTVLASDDAGATWQQRYSESADQGRFSGNGLEVTCPNRVVPDPVRPDRLWFCYADIGLLVTDDHGRTFRRSHQGMHYAGNCFAVVVDPQTPSTIWAATGQWERNQGDVCRSDDGGQTWRVVGKPETGLPDGQVWQLLLDLKSPASSRRLLATSKGTGVVESLDGGLSWHAINGNLPAQATKQPCGLLLHPANPACLIATLEGTPDRDGGVYVTRDAGRSWQRTGDEFPFAKITSLAADPRDGEVLYVTARQHYDSRNRKVYPGGLFVSRDGGRAWQRLLDFRFVQAVAVSPADSRVIYAGTNDHPYHDGYVPEGVLKSTDGGATWRHENAGLSHRSIHSLSVSPHDPSRLYLATGGNGVFVGKDSNSRSR